MRPPRLRVEGCAGRAPTLHQFLGPGICLTTEENHGKTSVRAPEKWSAYQRRARFVWSTWPSTSGGLDWSAGTRRRRFALRATGPTLGQSRYLPSCRTKGFPASANFESKLSVRVLMWSASSGTPKSLWICLLLRGARNKAEALGLQYLEPPDVGAGSRPPGEAFFLKNFNRLFLYWIQPFQKVISSGLARKFTKATTDLTYCATPFVIYSYFHQRFLYLLGSGPPVGR